LSAKNSTILLVFKRCVEAVHEGTLIKKISEEDKEFHFQNWFQERLDETPGRNTYPDFRMV